MTRAVLAPLAPALVALLVACSREGKPAPEPTAESAPSDTAAPETTNAEPLTKASVTLYFPSAKSDTLTVETREIVDTDRPAERGAQIVAALLDGPKTDGALPAFPRGTTLRRLWVVKNGIAYADFSEELESIATGGSADEILTIYAVVDSLTENVPAIRSVGILVAGREGVMLGHLDLRYPLRPDLSLAAPAKSTE